MKRIITLTLSILLLFASLSACTQSEEPVHPKQVKMPEVNWYYEFFSDKDNNITMTDNQAVLLNNGTVSVNQSVSCNGYTITLESAISDGYRSFFKFRVTAPAGISLDGGQYDFDSTSSVTDKNGEGFDLTLNSGQIKMQISPERCEVFASGGVSVSA